MGLDVSTTYYRSSQCTYIEYPIPSNYLVLASLFLCRAGVVRATYLWTSGEEFAVHVYRSYNGSKVVNYWYKKTAAY